MAERGRPIGSQIRKNIIEILYFLGEGYAYDIYKMYKQIFPNVTMRSVYYHLKKGVSLGEIKVNKIVKEEGEFSWGSTVEKTYYALGEQANPAGLERVRDMLQEMKNNKEE